MGLDITAYSHLRPLGKHTAEQRCEEEDHIGAFAYASFPASFRGIPVLSTGQSSDGSSFIEGGCYETTDATETHRFHAGSYRDRDGHVCVKLIWIDGRLAGQCGETSRWIARNRPLCEPHTVERIRLWMNAEAEEVLA